MPRHATPNRLTAANGVPYTRNHYVPQWYQQRFFLDGSGERKFYYLDLKPETFLDPKGARRAKTALRRWGTPYCFEQPDLYTTKFGSWQSTEIEERFFGRIDGHGRSAINYFVDFAHPSADGDAFQDLMRYMSVQKLRTPKGLAYISRLTKIQDRNAVLLKMQDLQLMHAAMWSEGVWAIAEATNSETKFIISDHPVTVYNREFYPQSPTCRDGGDPDIWLNGTHTLFPLSRDKLLILTNLSWVRNHYEGEADQRPNPRLFRTAMFDFRSIQTGRQLTEIEVNEINFIVKQRAHRYIAAAREEWLYPEQRIPTQHWRKLGNGYLLMPDPRSMVFQRELIIGYDKGKSTAFDEYGRRPGQRGYKDDELAEREWQSFSRFQGEFARVFGPKRRGLSYELSRLTKEEDDPEYHGKILEREQMYGPRRGRR